MASSAATQKWMAYAVGPVCVALAAALLKLPGIHINSTTAALAFLLIILFIATRWGSFPALFTSLLAMLCFNFFFLPPFGTLSIANPDNWVALVAFLVTAITAGQLSAIVTQRAEEAESGKREIERLYSELRDAFERASHAEALRQSEKLKTALLDAVTHDLRTPLASIKASITTLLDEIKSRGDERPTLDADSRVEMMEVIDEETDRLNRFIDGLIELARIEAGDLQLRRSWGAADEIISNALTRALPLTKDRKVEVEIEPELPVARVDQRAVSEVIYTLIENASKYSPPGTPIVITAKRADSSNLIMGVEDSGSGIDPQLRERVFDKFFRATRDGDISTHQPSGNEMGLAIAKGIVEAHSGKIWIESGKDNRGTRVLFTLPIGDQES
jgi:two-component system sensor histidine kinase KdpD